MGASASQGAQAAVVISMEQTKGAAPPKPATMILDGERLRLNTGDVSIIYRSGDGKAWVLRSADHSYIEMSAAEAQAAGQRMNDALAKLKDRLGALPEDQRKRLEAMMAPAPAASAAPLSLEKAGAPRTIGAWSCVPYQMMAAGRPAANLCLANLDDLGLSRDDLKPLIEFGAFSAKLVGALGRGSTLPGAFDFDAVSKAVGFAAIPIESTTRIGAADPIVTTLKSIDRHDVDPEMFELPSGYAKRALGPKPTKSATP
jgi:hypothetical protein